jgi:hypothetical protein
LSCEVRSGRQFLALEEEAVLVIDPQPSRLIVLQVEGEIVCLVTKLQTVRMNLVAVFQDDFVLVPGRQRHGVLQRLAHFLE